MSAGEELSPAQKRAYDLITSEDGLLQSELWKALDADSRKGSRLATALAEKGLITREETIRNGRKTYLLNPANGESPPDDQSPDEGAEEETGAEAELRPREKQALSLIQERNGIYQSEFWKELDVSSRTGSRIASSLEEKGLIRREEAVYNGRQTYLLKPAKEDLDFSLLMAGNEISPLIGADEEMDPIESEEFTQWVLKLAQENRTR